MTFGLFDKVTFWAQITADPLNPFAAAGWSAPVTIQCEYESGSETRKDQNGAEFMPRTVIYTAQPIPTGSKVIIGVSTTATPPANAETIRASQNGTVLLGQSSEFEHFTS